MFQWFSNLGMSVRVILATVVAIAVVVVANYVVFVSDYRESAERALEKEAAVFTAVADEAKNHASRLAQDRVYDQAALVAEVESTLSEGRSYESTRMYRTIPVVAGWTAAQAAAEWEGVDFRVMAFNARNPEREPAAGSFRESLLRDLRSQVESGASEVISRVNPETNAMHHVRAIRLDASCMMCHGQPGNQFDADGDRLEQRADV